MKLDEAAIRKALVARVLSAPVPVSAARVEPAEVIAERARRKALLVAEQALDEAKTPAEKVSAIGGLRTALELNGLAAATTGRPEVSVEVVLADEDRNADEAHAAPATQ